MFGNTPDCESSNRLANGVSGVESEELIATDPSTLSNRVELFGSVENEVDAMDENVAFDNQQAKAKSMRAPIDASPVMLIKRYSLLFD